MGLKGKAKEILGLMRAKIFGVTAGQNVYIINRNLVWGDGKNWKGIRNW